MLTNENYFSPESNRTYMSVSQFKSFLDCEARTMAEVNGEYHRPVTDALLVGSYVDAFFEGSLESFVSAHPEIVTKKGERKAQYRHADYIIQRVQRDKKFMQYMGGQKQKIFTGEIGGVPFKSKIDSYHDGIMIVDLKVVRDFQLIYSPEKKQKLHFIDFWRYDIQGAVYREIVRQNTGKTLPFYIAAVTKEPEPDLELFWIPNDVLDAALEFVQSMVNRFQKIKSGELLPMPCGTCDYCRARKEIQRPINYKSAYDFEVEDDG